MKVIHKIFVIVLLLSLIFSVSAVAAQDIEENMTFEQGNMGEVSDETLNAPAEETLEVNSVEEESSVNAAEDDDVILKASEKDQLAADEPANFSVISKAIDNAKNGDTIYLNGSNYVSNGDRIYFQQKNLTIVGGSSLGDGKYATLDARGLSSILSISNNENTYFYYDYYDSDWNCAVTLDSIIFTNADVAIRAACHLNINNCYFINNSQAILFKDCIRFEDYYYYGGYSYSPIYNLNVLNSYFINNTRRYGSIVDVTNSPKTHTTSMDNPRDYGKKTFRNCLFENNTANYGGAISLGYGANIQDCTFIGNSAHFGGAIYHTQSTYYSPKYGKYVVTNVINNSIFINNSAVEGGAIYGDFINITGSKFIDNVATFYGGALNIKSFMTINISNNEFTNNYAPYYNSHSMFITTIEELNSVNVDFSENIVNSDKTEIYFDKPVTGLYTYILDGTTVQFCEGNIKIYALVTDDEGNRISTREFRFLVGDEEFVTRVLDSVAEIDYQATIANDNGKIVSVNTTDYKNVYTGKLEIIPFSVVFDFEDYTGAMGTAVKVPVYVNDASGHPLEKTIIASYNGHEKELVSYNGIAHVLISLPLEKTSFNLAVECDGEVKVRKVYVMDPHDDTAIVIDMAENENGYIGRTITLPITVHDGKGNGLIGDISVSYNGKTRIMPLIDGQADVLVSLPVYETSFDLSVSFKGTSKICTINVIDPVSEIEASIDLPHNVTGNIGEGIIIPVSVVDQDENPLTGDIIISYNDQEITRSLNTTGQYGIAISLPLHETSFELTVNYKGNIKSCLVYVINPNKITQILINVNDTYTSEPGKSITIPVSVVDQNGNPLSGEIFIEYNDHEKNATLTDGKADIVIGLPVTETSFEVAISYNGHTKITQVNVVDNKPHVNSIINLPETKTENIGKTIVIPVYVTDENGNHMQGDVVIYYNNKETTQTLVNGHTNIIISSQLHPTSFEVTVAYKDKQAHCLVDVIDPNPVKPVITMPESESGHVGKTIIIPVKVFDEKGKPLQGEIGIYYEGKEFTETLQNGLADVAVILPDTPTTFNLTIAYGETSKDCLITVKNASDTSETNDTTVVIEIEDDITGSVGKTKIIPIFVHDGKGNPLNGELIVTYNNNEREINLKNGKANIVLTLPSNPTTFDLTIIYGEIFKITSVIVVDSNNPMGDLTEITSNGTSIVIPFPKDATGNVTVNINGKEYNGTVVNGEVIVNIDDLPDGEYGAVVSYSGDGNYSASEKTVTIIIKDSGVVDSKHPLANITDVESNGDGLLVIPFPSDATGNVIVTINGKNYTGTIVDGKVVLDIKDLPAGNYTSIIYYSGDGNYTNSTKTIVVIKDNTAVSPDNPMGNVTETESKDGSISIPFPNDASGNVVVNIDGKYYNGKVIDGKVVLDVKDLPNGNYNANVYYLGGGNYSASARTIMFIIKETNNNNQQNTPVKPPVVNKKASKITAKKKTFKRAKKVKKYSITLKSGKTPIKKVKVTIKIGKKTYKAKTNNKGKATFKIKKLTKKGKYKAVIKFKGDKTYKASIKKVKITIV
ncbi:Ig-like domain-containing protein [uncultured Methanobrevibacter sp.]|uniref:Ig-like domain-containing protein n=1 Tax=uncultured Methanobrevibacter sp. TaxID=253161 RepID=UPI002600562C|nr:Ig-like domain-containing protein [uncultured Methanobrevibacter sp.]